LTKRLKYAKNTIFLKNKSSTLGGNLDSRFARNKNLAFGKNLDSRFARNKIAFHLTIQLRSSFKKGGYNGRRWIDIRQRETEKKELNLD